MFDTHLVCVFLDFRSLFEWFYVGCLFTFLSAVALLSSPFPGVFCCCFFLGFFWRRPGHLQHGHSLPSYRPGVISCPGLFHWPRARSGVRTGRCADRPPLLRSEEHFKKSSLTIRSNYSYTWLMAARYQFEEFPLIPHVLGDFVPNVCWNVYNFFLH